MYERNRLIELLQTALEQYDVSRGVGAIADELLANGVIVPPCRAGDKVFFINHINDTIPDFIYDDTITKIGVTTRGIMHEKGVDFADFGKTVFFTREEAEAALAVRKEDEGK